MPQQQAPEQQADLDEAPAGGEAAPGRVAALDMIRGVAVMGILAINVSGYAGPVAGTDTPALPHGAHGADEAVFAALFVLFEGKMRALFSLLFGASMLLLIDRLESAPIERRRNGEVFQARRLLWLALFGYLHYLLLWWGDILFDYALCGFVALALRRLETRSLVVLALMIFAGWHLWGALSTLPETLAEEHMRLGVASLAEQAQVAQAMASTLHRMDSDMAIAASPFWTAAGMRLSLQPGWPLWVTLYTAGETLPLMLLGMALWNSGLLAGHWPVARLRLMAVAGLGLGLSWTTLLLAWAWPRHFPALASPGIIAYWAGPGHLAMALGYLALLVLAAPRLLATWLGRRLAATGRMAFSNYLGSSLVMTFVFSGWGLGLTGHLSRAQQVGLALLGWGVMLGWSEPWLRHFRQGPLEWLWRSLTEGRPLPLRRHLLLRVARIN